jgi:hypothetical protein
LPCSAQSSWLLPSFELKGPKLAESWESRVWAILTPSTSTSTKKLFPSFITLSAIRTIAIQINALVATVAARFTDGGANETQLFEIDGHR